MHKKHTAKTINDMLESCPTCEYALAGLPVRHVCPECGSEFDKRSSLFAPKKGQWYWGRRAIALNVFGGCVAVGNSAVMMANMGLAAGHFLLATISLAAAFTCLGVVSWRWGSRRRGTRIVFGPTHLEIARIGRRRVRLPWTKIGSIDFSFVSGGATLRRANGEVLITLRLFPHPVTKEFIREANAWRHKLALEPGEGIHQDS